MFDFLDDLPEEQAKLFTKIASKHLSSLSKTRQDIDAKVTDWIEAYAKMTQSDTGER